jgi:hypothetical protein
MDAAQQLGGAQAQLEEFVRDPRAGQSQIPENKRWRELQADAARAWVIARNIVPT